MGRDPPLIKGRPWSPGQMDVAETFDGSDGETVSQSNTVVESGGIELGGYVDGTTVSREADNSTYSGDYEQGVVINPNTDLLGVSGVVSANTSSLNTLLIKRVSDGTQLASIDASGLAAGDSFTIEATLSAGTEYVVGAAGNSNLTAGLYNNAAPPYTSGDVDITAGWYSGSKQSGRVRVVNDITALVPPLTGSATVQWPMPDDLAGWDIIPFEATEDGGTVEIYAIDPSDGSTLAGPLDDPGDISALARSTNVGVGVELSRTDTSQNPRLEAAYRRYKV